MIYLHSLFCKVNAKSNKLFVLLEPHSSFRFQYGLSTMTTCFEIAVYKPSDVNWYFKHSDWFAVYKPSDVDISSILIGSLSTLRKVDSLHSEMMDGVGFRFTVVTEEEILQMLIFLKNIALSPSLFMPIQLFSANSLIFFMLCKSVNILPLFVLTFREESVLIICHHRTLLHQFN